LVWVFWVRGIREKRTEGGDHLRVIPRGDNQREEKGPGPDWGGVEETEQAHNTMLKGLKGKRVV